MTEGFTALSRVRQSVLLKLKRRSVIGYFAWQLLLMTIYYKGDPLRGLPLLMLSPQDILAKNKNCLLCQQEMRAEQVLQGSGLHQIILVRHRVMN